MCVTRFLLSGLPFKPGYRRYKILGVQGVDDYRSIHEVISRRYRKLSDENEVFPDILLIDGEPQKRRIRIHFSVGQAF